jgi:GLPGLI family protein
MKKAIILTISLMLFHIQIIAQEILDTSYLECTYKFVIMRDTVEKKKSTGDTDMRLLVGNKYSKFYSHKVFARDSLLQTMTENDVISVISSGGFKDIAQKYNSIEGYKIYTNHRENKIIFTDIQPPNKIQYSEDVPKQDWKILSETKDIDGYKCQKATCRFRGRDYEAWFTREILVNEGPWKFNGLPGLIVKVYDTQEHYDFELTSVHKVNRQITFNEQSYPKGSLNDHIKMCRYRIQNPLANMMQSQSWSNVRTTFSPDPKQYDVMERDIK